MSVLVKGMEMPKKGYKDIRIHADGSWTAYAETVPYNDIYGAAVEVPTPHGRLKDVDVIIKDECHSCDGSCEVIECDCLNCTKAGCDTIRALNDAPTIIEAEE